jgi:hypothetical protein
MSANSSSPQIVAVTDRIGEKLTNGSQVFANALLLQLAQWFDLKVVVAEAIDPHSCLAGRVFVMPPDNDGTPVPGVIAEQLRLEDVGLLYNLGATAFGCAMTEAIRQRVPGIPLVNHYQVQLDQYARVEGWDRERGAAASELQRSLAFQSHSNIWPSCAELRAAAEQWGCGDRPNYVVPNAFVGAPVIAAGRRNRPFTFLAAGRFSDRVKGADLLYRAFAGLVSRHPEVRLEIASDDRRFLELLHEAPADSWSMLGWLDRSELLPRLQHADVVVVPSRYEPFGMIAVEAMSMGTPVIAMAVGGLIETVWHDVTGWLCPASEGSLGLRLAMEGAAADPEKVRRVGRSARVVAEHEYSLPRIARRICGHLQNAVHRDGELAFRSRADYAAT